jgi:toxin-antitoxin system PIN domain toxin
LIALPDVNVLLALAWSNHRHHEAAHRWFARESAAGWATCLLTQTAFLRLSLNPRVVGVSITCQAALALLEGLVTHPHHQYVEMSPPLTTAPFNELARLVAGYRQVPDATLLHLAKTHSMKLVTFDKAATAVCPWSENLDVLEP